MKAILISALCATGLALFIASGCQTGAEGPAQVGSQTNWLKACDASDECGDLVCLCGTCTISCDGGNDCAAVSSDSCVFASEEGASAICDGVPPNAGVCLPRCDDGPCPDGTSCVSGVCIGTPEASVTLTVDTATRYQTLIGFGASLGYQEDFIVGHPQKEELFDAMFGESGFDVVRLRNRFEGSNGEALDVEAEILAAAEDRLGRAPIVYLTSGSPPAALKANADRYCSNGDPTCTLISDVNGFDYAGFAEHWRSSLEAYEAVGVVADFVSIQNNANWIPPAPEGAEACRFLPQEGTVSVTTPDGATMDVAFPGYVEAMSAVRSAVATLPTTYSFVGPEIGPASLVSDYSAVIDEIDAVGVNFYSQEANDVDVSSLEGARDLAEPGDKPLFQCEVYAEALDSAVFIHHALVSAGASGYLQQALAGPSNNLSEPVLVGANGDAIQKHDTYYVMSHFSLFTDPGWIRVDTGSASQEVLSSAWLSPDEDALTIVLVNPGDEPVNVELNQEEDEGLLVGARVYRTALGGTERFADLGPLPEAGTIRLPARSVATVASPVE